MADTGLLKSLIRPCPIARSLPSIVAMARRDQMEAADKSLSQKQGIIKDLFETLKWPSVQWSQSPVIHPSTTMKTT